MLAAPVRPSIAGVRHKGRIVFGCLFLFILLFGAIFGYVLPAVSMPWVFYLGGRSFHLDPGWRGWGRMHSNISGDYAFYIRLQANMSEEDSGQLNGPAYICTPRGEIISFSAYGTMRDHLNLFTDGEAVTLDMSHPPALPPVFATADRRPLPALSWPLAKPQPYSH